MEPAIRKALLRKGTLYKDIPGALVAQLESVAEQHGLDAQSVASAFDKFMTTSRCASRPQQRGACGAGLPGVRRSRPAAVH